MENIEPRIKNRELKPEFVDIATNGKVVIW